MKKYYIKGIALFIIFLLFSISIPIYADNSLRGFKDVLGFESISAWKGLSVETKNIKQGRKAGAWNDTIGTTRIECNSIPHNLNQFNAVSIWIYSEKNNEAQIALLLYSDNLKTPKKDYYQFLISFNWTGWKQVLIPFESFTKKRSPIGFKKIDGLKLASTEYQVDVGPLASTHLVFDDLQFIKVDQKTIRQAYSEAMNFENVALWEGVKKNTQYVKQGKYSGAWTDTVKVSRVKTASIPKDWSDFNAIGFWVYSAINNHAEIEMIVDSQNPKTKQKDRYRHTLFINWQGWRYVKIRFDEFRADNMPIGWNKIDDIQFASSGYSKFPKTNTKLYFDNMKLIKEPFIISQKTRYKYFDKDGNYVNSITLSIKNFADKNDTVKFDLSKLKLNKFRLQNEKIQPLSLKPKETKEVTIKFLLNKNNFKKLDKLYHETINLPFISQRKKKTSIELSLFAPYYKGRHWPSLFLSDDEIEAAKQRIEKYDWAKKTIESFKKTAKEYSMIKMPKRGGGFLHGGPTGKYYPIFVKHEKLTRAARYYAILYRLTGKKKYLEGSKKILLDYADLLPKLPVQDKYGNIGEKAMPAGGRWGVQILSDSKLLIFLAYAYDLIKSNFTIEEQEKIEKNIFRQEGNLLFLNNEGRHNHQIWYSSTLAVMGYLLGDGEYINRALNNKEVGFFTRILKDSFTPSGWYYERTTGYQYFVMFGMTWFLEAAYHVGEDYYNLPIIKKIYTVPFKILSSNFKLPIINDGRGIDPLEASRAWVDLIAYERYKDPVFLPIITRINKNNNLDLVLHDAFSSDIKTPPNLELSSLVFPQTGFSVIRAERDVNKDFFFFLDFSPHIASHIHPDRLQLLLFDFGEYVMPDPGSLKYRSKYHLGWMKATIAHNTMCVDMNDQNDYKKVMPFPTLDIYNITPKLKVIKSTAKQVYDGVNFSREVLMVDDTYLLDRFKTFSQIEHTYDLSYHLKGEPEYRGFKMNPKKNFYPKNPHYSFIENFSVERKFGDVVVDYKIKEKGNVRLHYLGEKKQAIKLIGGKGVLSDLYEEIAKEKANILILRKEKKNTDYSTILEPYQEKSSIISVEKNKQDKFISYSIKRQGDITDYILLNDANKITVSSNITTDASVAYIQYKNKKLIYVFVDNGSSIKLSEGNIKIFPKSSVYLEKNNNKWIVSNTGKNSCKIVVIHILGSTKTIQLSPNEKKTY